MREKGVKISRNGSLLVYQNGYEPKFIEQTIEEHNLKGLRIWTDPMPDPPPEIGFLSNCSFLEGLDVTSLIDYDFSFLKDLPNLKRLSVNTIGKTEINLINQRSLEYLAIEWRKGKIRGLENCKNLSSLGLIDYSEQDLNPIRSVGSLKDLRIKTAGIVSVEGIEELHRLERLLLGNCRKLTSIRSINGLEQLESLEIEACRKISDFDELTNLPKLEHLRLTNCGEIASLAFTDNFPSLERLVINGNTTIADRSFRTPLS